MEGVNERKQDEVFGVEDGGEPGDIDSPGPEYGFHLDDLMKGLIFYEDLQQDCQLQSFSDDLLLDIGEHNNEENHPHTTTSVELFRRFRSGFKRINGEKIIEPTSESICVKEPTTRLSTEEIMRVAGTRFIQSSSQTVDIMPILSKPLDLSLSGLSSEEIEDIELADMLLASAEKVSNQEYEHASKLLSQCDRLSSSTGNPVQRVVYYFSKALREKSDRESKGSRKNLPFDIPKVVMSAPNSAIIANFKHVPFCQVEQFAGVQAIVENMARAKRVHIIDFGIKCGVQWTLLMQALASRSECPLESLKITAVGSWACSRQMEIAGKWLMSFAETMNLPFSFMEVTMSAFDLKEDQFEIDAEETIAIYSEFFLWTMIPQPDRLDSVMNVIRKFNPCIMVIVEVESNLNSPYYLSRFIEALFYYSAYFDCLDVCMEKEVQNRLFTESLMNQGIKSVVVAEGEERKVRHVTIDVWRAFLSRFGMEEKELSMSSLYQAYLMVKNFACGNSCTLDRNGKSLIIGWKGTPIHSVSVWKFL
ncbi:DELLA protein GAI1-like [Tripterygium wilfordii]|uniref:DELLA protein GAI1-like n=1 Tax=Tripterygium wilfordii TaxID=458696 RepID=UPI0018F7EDD0|nr:DELLA protein GAI1-like [Tripterygium wilfordii]XP_038719064.1 DELLA protein GAI1-like [Tripterygium wilfordii]